MEGSTQPTNGQNITTAQDLLKRLRAGIQETYEIRCRELSFPVRILSNAEMNGIRNQAKAHVLKTSGDETDKHLYMQKAVLKMASTMSLGGFAALSDKLLEILSVDEINYFYNEYVKVLEEANPNIDRMTLEGFRALVDAIKKKNIQAKDCSLPQLRAIFSAFQELIQQPETQESQTDNSSGGQR